MPFFYYYDPYYWMILVPAMLIALLAQLNVSATFNRYSRWPAAAALPALRPPKRCFGPTVCTACAVERVAGRLSDHYDPRSNVIRLSDGVYGSTSVASLGVAAHEAGHAVQYAQGYGPIKLRTAIIPVCNIGSQLSILLIVLGLIFYFPALFGVGVILFAVAVVGPGRHSAGGIQRLPQGDGQPAGHRPFGAGGAAGGQEGAHCGRHDVCGRPAGIHRPAAALPAGLGGRRRN